MPRSTRWTLALVAAGGMTALAGGSASAAGTCPVGSTEVATNVCEVTFTVAGVPTAWIPPADVSAIEAVLVGAGGSQLMGYAGGGGEVTFVTLAAGTPLSVRVGGPGNPGGDPVTLAEGTVIIQGDATYTARGGHDGGLYGDNYRGGTSGNGHLGSFIGSSYMGAGGGAGLAAVGRDGGAGRVVGAFAGAGSLFAGVTSCFGGGGAAATGLSPSDIGTATCGGGFLVGSPAFTAPIANSGGGASGWYDTGSEPGATGIAIIRFSMKASTPTPTPTPTATPAPTISIPSARVAVGRTLIARIAVSTGGAVTVRATLGGAAACTTTRTAARAGTLLVRCRLSARITRILRVRAITLRVTATITDSRRVTATSSRLVRVPRSAAPESVTG